MALDRFITWQDEKPTDEQLLFVLEDFLGGVGEITNDPTKEGHPWWTIKLPGTPTHPLRRAFNIEGPMLHEERWFEVYVADDHIDVMTRLGDAFTNALADKFAEVVCRAWRAKSGLPADQSDSEDSSSV
jgi:hypothetical protein